jgi:gliding motility-associated-like protein
VSNSQPSYIFDLVASDNSCPQPRTSTIRVVLIVRPDPNILPSITTSLGTNQVDIVVTDNLSFLINGIDLDNDDIEIEVLPRNFRLSDLNMQVADKSTGKGNLSIPFNWQTDCRAVKDINNRYIIDFIITDNKPCFNTKDTVTVEINLRDQPFNDANFLPANAFTPNRDGLNESFMINDFPDETCLFRFKKIEIYNRWGGLVFESKDKNFRWEATDFAAGQYFYSIDYGKKSYKNQLQIIK